jgi:two-component system, chemotaxis family, chemotaxis protein CheY
MDKQVKILTVDDSAFMRKIIIDILNESGFTNIIEAENGVQAIEKVKTEKPDLVLLDIIMPDRDGIEVLKEIVSETKVIMVSAVGQESIISDATNIGAKGFIIKPFEKEVVISEINKILG